jgi:tripartite-type tricarboxylate transporter receptor subunit TctC
MAGGHAQILMDSIISLLPMAKEGKVRPIAVTSSSRVGIAPDIPTAAESGYPQMVYYSWYGVWAPKDTPDARVKLLHDAFNTAVKDLARAGALSPLGILPIIEDLPSTRQFIEQDVARSAELLRASGFKAE